MSNIFESLKRAQPKYSGVDLRSFIRESAALQQEPAALAPRAPISYNGESPIRELCIPELAPLFPFDGTNPRAGEEYRILRTRIVQHQKQPRCLVISSAGVGDGKSTTTINMAAAFALKSDAKILLIDGDFRRTTVASKLGLPNDQGLSKILTGNCTLESAIVRAAQIPNLHIMPAGKAMINPSEMLDSPAWASLVFRCRTMYKYIFIDSPPVGAVADFDLIESHCDGIILVVRQDHTKRAPFLEMLNQIPKERLIGVVLNSTTPWPLGKRDRSASYYYRPDAGAKSH